MGTLASSNESGLKERLLPKSVVCAREGYTREGALRDVIAGVVVGVVALPLALAFAIASGVPPERGLYTAVVAGFLISALGGSRVQIGGPTGAFVVIVYGVVAKHGYDGLVIATLLAGVMLIALGLARLGTLIKFIPYPVVTGFTSGIAVVIFSSQVKDLLGLRMGAMSPHFLEKWEEYARNLHTLNRASVAVAAGSLIVIVLWPRVSRRVPGPFVAMVLATLAVQVFSLNVDTIGSRFGAVPSSLPMPHLPGLTLAHLRELISPAVTIALLAAIESLLSAVVADGMIGTRHKSNTELVAQGVANMASAVFGGIPATGAIARTATNIKTGGRTPLAGMTHAVTLLLVLLLLGRWAAMIPLSALSAILVVVSYNMSEWRSFRGLLTAPKSDIAVLVLTFFLTVFVDLTVAVQVGVVASALLFMKRMAEVTYVEGITDDLRGQAEDPREITGLSGERPVVGNEPIPEGVEVFEVNGPFFFGAADKLKDVLTQVSKPPRVFILRMRHVPAIDATGIHSLEQFCLKCRKQGTALLITEIQRQPRRAIIRAGKLPVLGRQNFLRDMHAAVARARVLVAAPLSGVHRLQGPVASGP